MAFNKKNIKGMGDFGDQLLSEMSKAEEASSRKTEFIKYELLDPSDLNKDLSKKDIDSLAEQIYHEGLDQALVVMQKDNGRYEVLGGERRLLAIGKLIATGRYPEDHLVECKIKKLKDSSLPLSDEDKRVFTWLSTNQYRDKTDNDRYIEAIKWKDIIKKLREKGINLLVAGYTENGDLIEINMAGIRTRELVATQTKMSPTQVGKVETIEAKGTDELKEALKDDKVNIANAAVIAKLPEKEQREFVETVVKAKKAGESVAPDEVKEFVKKKNKPEKEKQIELTKETVQKDLRDVLESFDEDNIKILSNADFVSYTNHIAAIKKLFQK